MDVRAVSCSLLAGIALVGAIVLFAIGSPDGATAILGLAGTFGAYSIGLYSEVNAGSDE